MLDMFGWVFRFSRTDASGRMSLPYPKMATRDVTADSAG